MEWLSYVVAGANVACALFYIVHGRSVVLTWMWGGAAGLSVYLILT